MEASADIFKLHSRVRLRNDGRIGIVIAALPDSQYQVFLNSDEQPILVGDDLQPAEEAYGFVDGQGFLRDLLMFKLRRPLSDTEVVPKN